MATPSSDGDVVMAWLRIDDNETEHPKVLALIELAGYEAYYRLHKLRGYCARLRTNGHFTRAAAKELSIRPKMLNAMIQVGLVDESDDGLSVHDWGIYNGDTVTERVEAYLSVHPEATANEVFRAIGGNRNVVLACVATAQKGGIKGGIDPDPSGTGGGIDPGTKSGIRACGPQPLVTASEINTISEAAAEPSAQTLTGEFVDACRGADIEAPRRVIGQIAQQTGNLLREGISGDAIRLGYRRMVSRGLIQPAMLPNFVAEASIPSGLRAVNGRGLTPSEILARTQEAQ